VPSGLTDYYVHVVISKDGEVSESEIIHVQSSGNATGVYGFAVDDLDLSGSIMTPVIGSPISTIFTNSSDQYTASDVTWSQSGPTFAAGTVYTATVTLTAISTATLDYNFDPDNSFTYSGAYSVSTTIPADRKTATVSITFPATVYDLSPFIKANNGELPDPTPSSGGGNIFEMGPSENSLWFVCTSARWRRSVTGDVNNDNEWVHTTDLVDRTNYYYRVTIMLASASAYVDFSSLTDDNFYCAGASDINVITTDQQWVQLDIFFPKL
jgi:hypothetical protein